jgi:hypothetical protein
MPEWYDPLPTTSPGASAPYQYFSSYSGRGYQPWGVNKVLDNNDMSDDEIVANSGMSYSYFQGVTASGVVSHWKPKTFQIISAGFDGELGVGGGFYNGKFFDTSNAERPAINERDNITNFSSGPLVP